MTYETIIKALDKIEPKLNQLPELAAGQRELADRVLQLEQKGSARQDGDLRQAPEDFKSDGQVMLKTAADMRAHYSATADRVSVADFLRGVAGMKTTSAATKSLSVGTDSAGGFAVPRGTFGDIMSALVPVSALLQAGASVVPVGDVKTLTTAVVNTIPTAGWRAENGAVVESDPTFRSVVIAPHSLSFRFKVSRELLADAPNMGAALNLVIAQALAKELDRAGLRGTGSAPEPRGIQNTSGIYTVGSGTNGASGPGYDTILSVFDDILSQDAPMPKAAIMSPRSWVRLMSALDTAGQPKQMPKALESLNLVSSSQVPVNLTVGTSTDCSELYVGDFSQMALMMRETVSIQLLNELYAETGQIGFVGHVRADVAVWYPAAFAVVTGLR
jgi:HK97 family phage major capsid protein